MKAFSNYHSTRVGIWDILKHKMILKLFDFITTTHFFFIGKVLIFLNFFYNDSLLIKDIVVFNLYKLNFTLDKSLMWTIKGCIAS